MNERKGVKSVIATWKTDAIEQEKELLKSPHFVVLDLETTGLSPAKGGRIIEIAAVRVVQGQLQDTFHTFVDPQLKIPPKVTQLTGITNKDVAGKPTAFTVLPELYQFIGDAVVVCHNVSFDWNRFLLNGFEQCGIYPKNETFCTMKFLKKIAPNRGRGGYRLDTMCELMGVSLDNHHQAMDDTVSTAHCLIRFVEEFVPEVLESRVSFMVEKKEKPHTPIRIKRVRYWEKKKNKREMFKRHYINVVGDNEFGTVYFDIPSRSWGNKNFPLPLDFEKVEKSVVQFLDLNDVDDLIHYRN